jgi:membrane fusion protein (multidrug efflux system)
LDHSLMASLSKGRVVQVVVGSLTAAAVVVGGVMWWLNRQAYEETDNAFVHAEKVIIAPQIDGYVAEVLVDDNQQVEPGQVLARIDDSSIRARLAQAEANAQALEAAVRGVDDKARLEQAMVAQKAAGVQSAHAQAQLASVDMSRYGSLADRGWVSSQRSQTAKAAAAQAAAAVAEAEATLEAERRAAQSLGSAREQMLAEVKAARAGVDQAKIDLSHAEIRAPGAGVVGAKSVRAGQYVRAGTSLMSLVPLTEAYVLANFKETQVARLRIGQPVEIRADAFGGQTIKGHVDSFAPATGSEFAMIPVENAVGNFTKIAQRLPVKIMVDHGSAVAGALRPGLSLHVKVDVRRDTGPSFAEAAAPPERFARRGASR